MSLFSRKINGQKIAINYPYGMAPAWFADVFSEMVSAYFYSATKPRVVDLSRLSGPTSKMVKRYFEVNKLNPLYMGAPKTIGKTLPLSYTQNEDALMISGGKDSIHLLLRLLELGKKPFCIYVKNLNRSETYYETRAVKSICEKLGVKFQIVEPTNSIKLNRMNHNIAFREELSVILALPYLISNNVKTVYFGNLNSFFKIEPPMYASNIECLEFLNQLLKPYGPQFVWKNHIDYEKPDSFIFEEMVTKYQDILDMTSSCYTQLNFREHRYGLLKQKMPSVPIYQGCGSCIKCLRINAAILKFKPEGSQEDLKKLSQHIDTFFKEYYSNDIWLKALRT